MNKLQQLLSLLKFTTLEIVVDDNHVIHKGYVDEQIAEVKENWLEGRVIITSVTRIGKI